MNINTALEILKNEAYTSENANQLARINLKFIDTLNTLIHDNDLEHEVTQAATQAGLIETAQHFETK